MAAADLPSQDTSQKCILVGMCPEGGDLYLLMYSKFLELLLSQNELNEGVNR